MNQTAQLLAQFSPIDLSEMKSVELMNRVDTKFVFHKNQLTTLLNLLQPHYRILEIDSERISSYKNLYFDTEELKFYIDHHNGKTNRIKIRMRKYLETNVCFIEVKHKNKGRTSKKRMQIQDFEKKLSEETKAFVNKHIDNVYKLRPVLTNEFKRLTLVSLSNKERITIDIDLTYYDESSSFAFEGLVIAELKQPVFNRNIPFFNILKSMQINPYRISKYCIGMATLHSTLKQNAFKEKILRIDKIAG